MTEFFNMRFFNFLSWTLKN